MRCPYTSVPRGDRPRSTPPGSWPTATWRKPKTEPDDTTISENMGAPGKDTMRNPMFVYDEQLTSLILDYCRWRLALDPVPLDFGGAQVSALEASLEGLIKQKRDQTREGHGDLRTTSGHRGDLL